MAPAPLPLWQRRAAKLQGVTPLRLHVESKQLAPMSLDAEVGSSEAAENAQESPVAQAFSILGELGSGSTGFVQQAVRKADGRQVALKMTRYGEDTELLRIAKDEFELLQGIEHPNIVRALDCIVLPHSVCLVLEFFDGLDLLQTVSALPLKRMAEPSARHLCGQLVAAVGHLHERRIVHRDIKPQNVLAARSLPSDDDTHVRSLKLVDFNVARQLRESAPLTPTGTRLYSAPEVVFGETPSELSDIWAVGMCMHILLAGRLPQGRDRCLEHQESLQAAAERPIALAGPRWRDVSPGAKAVLRKCLAFEPGDRVPLVILAASSEWLAWCTGVAAVGAATTAVAALDDGQGQDIEPRRQHVRHCSAPVGQRRAIIAPPGRPSRGGQSRARNRAETQLCPCDVLAAATTAATAMVTGKQVAEPLTKDQHGAWTSRASTRSGSGCSSPHSECASPQQRFAVEVGENSGRAESQTTENIGWQPRRMARP
mmetsp:Transcript_52967/g.133849  ORF Transcript_52967/g.133849 Transcript_52967/m.133849 type:complete len:485 (-) Transcript_52967:23-1477(-)